MSNNIIIRASAGSGKTFQLSNRFLELAFRGAPWDAMLASTFTRKAAGEILDRILVRLAQAALQKERRDELAEFLKLDREISTNEIQDLLFNAVRNLHRIRVGTLDSFFMQIAKSFSLELGIPLGWEIVDDADNERFLIEAIREVFDNETTDDALRLMHLLSHGEASNTVSQEVFLLSKSLLHLYREAPESAWKQLKAYPTLSQEELERAIREFEQVPLPANKNGSIDANCTKARTNGVARLHEEQWNTFIEQGFGPKILDESYLFSRKPIEGQLRSVLKKLVEHAKGELVNRVKIQTEATYDLLKRVSEHYERIKEENKAFRFEDIPFRLTGSEFLRSDLRENAELQNSKQAPNQNVLDQIAHRLDAKLQHLLLDEFQDTAPIQWEILRPFALSAIHATQKNNGSFFCVGDMKQAIYGWRGGVAEIFMKVEQEITPLDTISLSQTYRSSQPVVETVNKVFENLLSNPALCALTAGEEPHKLWSKEADYQTAAERWTERFESHETKRSELPGFCTLETAPLYDPENPQSAADDSDDDSLDDFADTDFNDVADAPNTAQTVSSDVGERIEDMNQYKVSLMYTIKRIVQLHRQAPGATIGVLTRRNKIVTEIIRQLLKRGVNASEEGGNPLTDSPAVEIILSALTLADHPGDTVRRFHLANSPLGPILGISDEKNNDAANLASFQIRSDLLQRGYGAVVDDWIRIIAPSCDQRNLDRLLQLSQQAHSWDAHAAVRPERFVEMVRTTSVESPSAAKVRVMNIHQSKGLEFDIVVLPELAINLIGQNPPVVLGRQKLPDSKDGATDPTGPVERILRYTNESVQKFLPSDFQRMFSDYRCAQVEESLCMLYVAMTRAIHCLCMIIPPIKPPKKETSKAPAPRKKFDGILRYGLLDENHADVPESILYECGDWRWYQKVPTFLEDRSSQQDENQEKKYVAIELTPMEHPTRFVPRFSPSGLEGTSTKAENEIENDNEDDTPQWSDLFAASNVMVLNETPIKVASSKVVSSETTSKPIWETLASQRNAMLWGTAIHACFEKVLWLDQNRPSRKELEETLKDLTQSLPGQIEISAVLNAFEKICEKPDIQKALTLSQFGTLIEQSEGGPLTHRIFSERAFIFPWNEGIMRGSIDRLVVSYRGEEAICARIIDFKTDSFPTSNPEETLQEKIRFYAPQLHAYRDAVSHLYRIPEQKIETLLMFTSTGRVGVVS